MGSDDEVRDDIVSEYDVGEAVLLINEGRFLGGLQLVKSIIRRDQ